MRDIQFLTSLNIEEDIYYSLDQIQDYKDTLKLKVLEMLDNSILDLQTRAKIQIRMEMVEISMLEVFSEYLEFISENVPIR
jgi:phage-related protein